MAAMLQPDSAIGTGRGEVKIVAALGLGLLPHRLDPRHDQGRKRMAHLPAF